ncbi:Ig domain-containing protein [Rhizobium sp. IMFF44]|uniref:Ig domain-containing protein n=1 Tax=Rhizobium sp. IMFF44 TaxID=3342350 RepID=UPI0035B82F56
MRTAVAVLAALAALSNDASAGTFVLRSSTTGAIAAPVVAPPEEPTTPDSPAGFSLSIIGQASVAAGAVLDLRPVVSGASGSVSYSYSGKLPLGGTFDASTGRIAGRALIAGSYQVRISATDSKGASVMTRIVIVVA